MNHYGAACYILDIGRLARDPEKPNELIVAIAAREFITLPFHLCQTYDRAAKEMYKKLSMEYIVLAAEKLKACEAKNDKVAEFHNLCVFMDSIWPNLREEALMSPKP